jgi:putative sterol carrier protein
MLPFKAQTNNFSSFLPCTIKDDGEILLTKLMFVVATFAKSTPIFS